MKNKVLPSIMLLALAACGHADPAKNDKSKPMPLDPNPPFSASDIDSTVAETKRRMTTVHPHPHSVVKPAGGVGVSSLAVPDNGTTIKN